MSESIKITAFNNILRELVYFLSLKFPSNNSIKNYEFKLNVAITGSPSFVRDMFKTYVLPYKDQINNCNEKFFLKEFGNLFGKDNEFIDFNNIWVHPDNDKLCKARIFQYFIKLIKVC